MDKRINEHGSDLISCVMCTYRRATCVERSIQFFLDQDYKGEKELIIYNTDEEYPLELSKQLEKELGLETVIIINNNIDYVTGKPYDNIGSIRRDSIKHANGDYYICWDDDDVFLPWNIRQCVDGLNKNPECWAWKPRKSLFWPTKNKLEIAENSMEASVISKKSEILSHGFKNQKEEAGAEHLKWLEAFKLNKKLFIEEDSIPGYCFNWSDTGVIAGNKQSELLEGGRKPPFPFTFHKEKTLDYAKGPLRVFSKLKIKEIYDKLTKFIKDNVGKEFKSGRSSTTKYSIKQELVEKYISTEQNCMR
tara:strand:+ start:223 stop:1140 length:918 start_codon:yes stop_codon:yes gene_type:complete